MRQVGIFAAAGLYALDHNLDRLREDHLHAQLFGRRLAASKRVSARSRYGADEHHRFRSDGRCAGCKCDRGRRAYSRRADLRFRAEDDPRRDTPRCVSSSSANGPLKYWSNSSTAEGAPAMLVALQFITYLACAIFAGARSVRDAGRASGAHAVRDAHRCDPMGAQLSTWRTHAGATRDDRVARGHRRMVDGRLQFVG